MNAVLLILAACLVAAATAVDQADSLEEWNFVNEKCLPLNKKTCKKRGQCKWNDKDKCRTNLALPPTPAPTMSPVPTLPPTFPPTDDWEHWVVESTFCGWFPKRDDCVSQKEKGQKRCKFEMGECVPRNIKRRPNTPTPTASPITPPPSQMTPIERYEQLVDFCAAFERRVSCRRRRQCQWGSTDLGCIPASRIPDGMRPTARPTTLEERDDVKKYLGELAVCEVANNDLEACLSIFLRKNEKRCKYLSGPGFCLPRKMEDPRGWIPLLP